MAHLSPIDAREGKVGPVPAISRARHGWRHPILKSHYGYGHGFHGVEKDMGIGWRVVEDPGLAARRSPCDGWKGVWTGRGEKGGEGEQGDLRYK